MPIEENFALLEGTMTGRVSDDELELNPNNVQYSTPTPTFTQPTFQSNVDNIVDEVEQENALFEELSDVELRLEEANCYRALLKQPMFQDPSSLALKVQEEVRNFIKEKLRELVGIKTTKDKELEVMSEFSTEETKALKMLASRVLNTAPKTNTITVNKADVETKPQTVKPVNNIAATVPEKVKVPRKKKEDTVMVELPNGMKVETRVTQQTGIKKKQSLQEIADTAAQQAMFEASSKVNPIEALTGVKK